MKLNYLKLILISIIASILFFNIGCITPTTQSPQDTLQHDGSGKGKGSN